MHTFAFVGFPHHTGLDNTTNCQLLNLKFVSLFTRTIYLEMYKQHFYLTCYPTLLCLMLILLYIMQGYLLKITHDLCKAQCMRPSGLVRTAIMKGAGTIEELHR